MSSLPPSLPLVSSTTLGPCPYTSSSPSFDISGVDDIGAVLNSISQGNVRNLPPKMKYSIHVNHFRPVKTTSFHLSMQIYGCNRSYKYLKHNPWFVYSRVEDGLFFCLPCVLFSLLDGLGKFVSNKFDIILGARLPISFIIMILTSTIN